MKKVYKHFPVAGIAYYEALFAIEQIKVGEKLELKPEDNIYDEYAVEVYYKERKLGYIPKNSNYSISVILRQGWQIFEAYVQRVDREALSIDVALFVKEAK